MTEKNAVPVKAKKAKKRAAPPSVAREEFAPPVNAAGFLVRRQIGEESERLKFREEGGSVANSWALATVRPSRAWLLERWGSGSYRVVWLDAARRPCGTAPEVTIDIPDRPARPAYPNPPAAVAPPAPTADEVETDRLAVALKASGMSSLAGPLLVVRELMGLVDTQAAERERRRERDHELAIARVRAQAQEDVERLRAHYEGAAKVQAAPSDAASAKLAALEAEVARLKAAPVLVDDEDDEDDEDDSARIAGYVAAFEKSQLGQAFMAWAASKLTQPTV
jgi:hypothetical protein